MAFSCASSTSTSPVPSRNTISGASTDVTASYTPMAIRACRYMYTESFRLPSIERLGYYLGRTLGSGTYAKVKAAWSVPRSELMAMKILNKSAASRDYLEKFLPREVEILRKLRHHSNILHCYQIIETEIQVLFIMELAANGDLLDYINARRQIPEAESRYIFRQIISAVQFLHSNHIAHRDLKCENVLLSHKMEVKLADFGFSLDMGLAVARTPCGSYSYAAPELFAYAGSVYDPRKSDAWSLGVILYAMVCGRLPFGDDSQVRAMQKTGVAFRRPVSEDCRHLITGILTPSPRERFDVTDMLLHSWTASAPVRVPALLETDPKYTPFNCLSLMTLQHLTQAAAATSADPHQGHPVMATSSSAKQTHPLVARLEVYRRRLVEVVRRRSQDRSHRSS